MSEIQNPINKTTDPEGKIWFSGWLESKHFTNITIPEDQYSPYDISADKDGKHYIFEIKNRPCTSYAYNDNIIELSKFNILHTLAGEKYIINFFTDCFYISGIDDEHELQSHFCQKTNNWNRNKVRKVLVSYKHNELNKRNYNE